MNEQKLDVSLDYDPNHKYYIYDVVRNRKKKVDIYEIRNTENPYYHNIARIKPFLLAKSRALTGTVALKYIDDVVRIHTYNITFNKQHDDVIELFKSKTMTLTKEDKTTGTITWKNEGCYWNETIDYKTEKFDKNYYDDSDDDEYDDEYDEYDD